MGISVGVGAINNTLLSDLAEVEEGLETRKR
jgi:hypothetical protein